MTRVKRGMSHLKRRKNILKKTKGYMWGRKNLLKLAKTAVVKAGVYAHRDRRQKKRDFRQLWNIRINAALFDTDSCYSKFIGGLKKKGIALNRKILSELAVTNKNVFEKLFEKSK